MFTLKTIELDACSDTHFEEFDTVGEYRLLFLEITRISLLHR